MRSKNKPIAFRATEAQYNAIKAKAKKANMSMTDYLIATALQTEISVVEDLKPLLRELVAYGKNLNQLTTLANMGRIKSAKLDEAVELLGKNYDVIYELARKGRR